MVILAGGKGTRLGHLTQEVPKPMIEVCGKPVLQHQLEWAAGQGITRFLFIVNHLSESIRDHFGNGSRWDVQIEYYVEEQPLGTVGGIKELEDKLQTAFIVLYGDVMVEMDLSRLLHFHEERESQATLVLHPNDHPYDSDLVDMDEQDRITAFHSKPHDSGKYLRNLVNAGLYVFEPAIFPYLEKGVKADFGKDIFPRLVNALVMYGYNTPEYLKDMGTPDRLEKVSRDLANGRIERSNLKHKRKAIFLDRDGCLNEEVSFVYNPDLLHLYPYTPAAVSAINHSEYLAIVATNQSAVARNLVTEKGLREIHNKLETELGEHRAYLDAIYYCPHHPHSGFEGENAALKIDCECRKPKSGMLLQAAEKFNIDLADSWMIGDTDRDVQAGRGAGARTIGLQSGMGMKGARVKPDFMFENVLQAVQFIIEDPYAELYKQVEERYLDHLKNPDSKGPFVITIGGNTRSGKSTLAVYLKLAFAAAKHPVHLIELDNWILPKPERDEANSVFERFDILTLVKDVQKIVKGERVRVRGYAHHPDSSFDEIFYQVPVDKKQVMIIEGVVALSWPQLRGISRCKIFRHIDADELKSRFTRFYQWKGYDAAFINQLYLKRKIDEYDIIDEDCEFAHIISK